MTNPSRRLSVGELDSHTAYALWLVFAGSPVARSTMPVFEPWLTTTAAPVSALLPVGEVRITRATGLALTVEVVDVAVDVDVEADVDALV